MENGICFATGEYEEDGTPIEEYIPLSAQERKKHENEIQHLTIQIELLELYLKEYLEKLSPKTNQIMSELSTIERKEIDKVYLTFDIIIEKNIRHFTRKHFNLKRLSQISTDQQKAILQVFYIHCLDKNGFLSQKYLSLGLQLAQLNVPDDTTISECVNAMEQSQKLRGIDDLFDDKELKKLIDDHKNLFFKSFFYNNGTKATDNEIYNIISLTNSYTKLRPIAREELTNSLAKDFHVAQNYSEQNCEYNKTISEYLDILSAKLPLNRKKKTDFEQLYRIVYSICKDSKGKYHFSYTLVRVILYAFNMKDYDWLFLMYLRSYYHKHKKIEKIVEYLETKAKTS